jgi:glycerol-3-phosphate dehydrogenase
MAKRLDGLFDVAVVGAGVVGCAVARRFVLEGARVVLLEKGADILSGASKANSAILHTGFDAPSGSLEVSCMQRGYAEYLEIADRLNLPLFETGAVVAAWNPDELARLDQIEAQARENGVDDVCRLDRQQMLEREPNLSPAILGGLLVPREHVIDPWSAPLAYVRQAAENGCQVVFDAELTKGVSCAGEWHLETTRGALRARFVVNCAGLWGDKVEALLLGQSSFEIKPRKGQFVVLDKTAAAFMRTTLLPVPTERTKGVVIVRTAFGNVLVGPTAEEQEDRVHASVESRALQSLLDTAARLIPPLKDVPVTAVYAGLRPATEKKEYRVRLDERESYIAVGGIRSTGLTAALGIATHVYGLYAQAAVHGHAPLGDPVWPRVPNLCEHLARDWEAPGDNEIVCHCELVTRREIDAALAGPLAARDLGGLKRRTRACMGRCQGFYCSARVAQLCAGKFAEPVAIGDVHD